MKKWIIKTNNWYDSINEPWRFFLMLAIVIPGLLALQFNSLAVIGGALWFLGWVTWRIAGTIFGSVEE